MGLRSIPGQLHTLLAPHAARPLPCRFRAPSGQFEGTGYRTRPPALAPSDWRSSPLWAWTCGWRSYSASSFVKFPYCSVPNSAAGVSLPSVERENQIRLLQVEMASVPGPVPTRSGTLGTPSSRLKWARFRVTISSQGRCFCSAQFRGRQRSARAWLVTAVNRGRVKTPDLVFSPGFRGD
jgi:hypothetical protein